MVIIRHIMFLLVLCSFPFCEGSDIPLGDFSEQEERKLLIPKHENPKSDGSLKISFQDFFSIPNYSLSREDTLFPLKRDIWLKIILRVNDPIALCSLLMLSKGMNKLICEDKFTKATLDLSKIQWQLIKYRKFYYPILLHESRSFISPELEERDIQIIANLRRQQMELVSFLKGQQGGINLSIDDSNFQNLKEILKTTDKIFEDIVPLLLDHSVHQNPSLMSLCQPSGMSDDLAYLSGSVRHTLAPAILNLERVIKITGKNRPIIIGGTILSLAAFTVGAYYLHQSYPEGVLEKFMAKNTTGYVWTPTGYVNEPYFNDCCNVGLTFVKEPREGPGYFFGCDQEWIKGNWTDWINYLYSISGCSIEQLSNQLADVTNATINVMGPRICMPSDNTTLCCLKVRQNIFNYSYTQYLTHLVESYPNPTKTSNAFLGFLGIISRSGVIRSEVNLSIAITKAFSPYLNNEQASRW